MKFGARLTQFLFPSATDTWLTVVRVGLALQVGLYCFSLRADWQQLYSSNASGTISRELAEAILSADSIVVPRLGWIVTAGEHVGLSEATTLNLVWWLLLLAAASLLLGLFCRTAALTTWLLYLCAVKSGTLESYGVDNFTTIGLFYLAIAPLPDRLSLDFLLRKLPLKSPELLGFHLRVLQVHLCFIYFFSGITKAFGPGWWNGNSLWRALTRPPFDLVPINLVISVAWLLPVASIGICLLEIGYPFLIWPPKTRLPVLGAILAMHLGIGLLMGLYLFALVMIILNLSGFGTDLLRRRFPARPQSVTFAH